ncbi:MAG: AraC family transcriptional regulator [Dehalobacterium sp.]
MNNASAKTGAEIRESHELVQISFNVSIKDLRGDEVDRSLLNLPTFQKQLEDTLMSTINSWPWSQIASDGKGQFIVLLPLQTKRLPDGVNSRRTEITLSQDYKKKDFPGYQHGYFLEKAVRFIKENYDKELKLEDVARQVYLSPNYFSRLFKEVKGYSFMHYLTQIRMEKARRLLIYTDFEISEIAERIGYRNAQYFGQVFKQNEGCTPTNYRRNVIGFLG